MARIILGFRDDSGYSEEQKLALREKLLPIAKMHSDDIQLIVKIHDGGFGLLGVSKGDSEKKFRDFFNTISVTIKKFRKEKLNYCNKGD